MQRLSLMVNNDGSESVQSDEDELLKDIANDFSAVGKTGPPTDPRTKNNVLLNSVSWKQLVQKLEKHSLKIKKCNPEIWSEILQSKTRSKDRKTLKMQGCILKAVGAISKVTNTLLELDNSKNLNTTPLGKNGS